MFVLWLLLLATADGIFHTFFSIFLFLFFGVFFFIAHVFLPIPDTSQNLFVLRSSRWTLGDFLFLVKHSSTHLCDQNDVSVVIPQVRIATILVSSPCDVITNFLSNIHSSEKQSLRAKVMDKKKVSVLDYGAGNVRSLRNAIKSLGYDIEDISTAEEIAAAHAIVFPGVGKFGQAMQSLQSKGWLEPLRAYIRADRPFFGICIGMQCLFEGSDESSEYEGLGIIPGRITRFNAATESGTKVRVPQMGWNGISPVKDSVVLENTKPGDSVRPPVLLPSFSSSSS